MCDNCFNTEIESFPDGESWRSFDLELTMKLGQGKMKPIELAHDPNRHDKHGETNYECMSCGEKWKLNDPDNAFRGYFLKRSTVIKVPNRLTTAQTIGLVLLGVLVIRVIYGFLMN